MINLTLWEQEKDLRKKFKFYKCRRLMTRKRVLVFLVLSIGLRVLKLNACGSTYKYDTGTIGSISDEIINNRTVVNSTKKCFELNRKEPNQSFNYCEHNSTCSFVLIRFNHTHDQEEITCICQQACISSLIFSILEN
jgi:hypothetical protein